MKLIKQTVIMVRFDINRLYTVYCSVDLNIDLFVKTVETEIVLKIQKAKIGFILNVPHFVVDIYTKEDNMIIF